MAYEENPLFPAPPDDTIIWRYMDLPKLLSLLEQRALYFALLSEMEDGWEGVLPNSLVQRISGLYDSNGLVGMYEAAARLITVNCWYTNDFESIAMWSLYTREPYGTAIKSTVGRFKRAVAATPAKVVALSSVRYHDYEAVDPIQECAEQNALEAVLCKRRCFEHERELRAIAPWPLVSSAGKPSGYVETVPYAERGQLVQVELSDLIEEIVLGPHFPGWAQALLLTAIERAAISPRVRPSDAYIGPPGPLAKVR